MATVHSDCRFLRLRNSLTYLLTYLLTFIINQLVAHVVQSVCRVCAQTITFE